MAIAQVQISKSYGFVINTHYEQRMSIYIYIYIYIYDALRHLVPFLQFKKSGKHPWRSVTLSKVVSFRL